MSHIHKSILRPAGKRKTRSLFVPDQQRHTIRLHSDGSIHEGLSIEGSTPEGFTTCNPNFEGQIHLTTARGKRWSLRFNEFSFIIGYKKPAHIPKAKPEVVVE